MVTEANKSMNQVPEFLGQYKIDIKKKESNLLLIDKQAEYN